MDEKTFVIALNAADDQLNSEQIKNFVKFNPDFTAWWNHLPFVYLVQTRLSADDVSEQMTHHTKGGRFLVMEVNSTNSNGWLPEKSWNWITRREDALKRQTQ